MKLSEFRELTNDTKIIQKSTSEIFSKNQLANRINQLFPSPDNIFVLSDYLHDKQNMLDNYEVLKHD